MAYLNWASSVFSKELRRELMEKGLLFWVVSIVTIRLMTCSIVCSEKPRSTKVVQRGWRRVVRKVSFRSSVGISQAS